MAVTLIRLSSLLLLLWFAWPLHAADEPAAGIPDPAALPADWWSYFEPKEPLDAEALANRVSAAKTFYTALAQRIGKAGDKQGALQIDRIVGDIDRFLELKSAPAAVPVPAITAADSYTLDNALQRFGDWQVFKQQVDAEADETAWLTTVLGEQRKQQSRLRNQYLEMDSQSPDRLARGLELMRKRLPQVLQRLELERRKTVLKQNQQRLERMRTELDGIAGRLVATPQELPRWELEYSEAQQAIGKLREEIDQVNPPEARSNALSQDLSEPQYTALVAVRRDIEIRIHELSALRAQLAQSLIRLVAADTATDSKEVRARIAGFGSLEASIADQRKRWKQVVERVRGMLAESDSKASTAAIRRLHDNMLRELDLAEQLLRRLQRERAIDEYVVEILNARLHASEGWWNRSFTDLTGSFMKAGGSTIELLGTSMFEINETPVTALGLLRVVLILTITLWLSRVIRATIQRVGERRGGLNQSSLYTFGRLVHYLLLTIGIIVGLSSIGIDFTKFALFASALGVGIGFGLQTLISNFVAGLIILFEKSLKVGDFVELESGVTGEVKEINMRSTLITTNDNIDILVPNSEFVGGRVINWTLRDVYRRTRIPFGVAYGTDKDKVKQAALEASDNVPWTLKNIKSRQPQVWFVEFGDSSLNFELVVWLTPEAVKRPGAVTAAYLWEIESKLKEYDIEIPFPQRDLHLRSVFGHTEDEARAAFAATMLADAKHRDQGPA